MGFFGAKNQQGQQMSERQEMEARFAGSRHNLLIVLIFTVVNIVLLVTNSNSYFLFSAYIPYLLVDLGMYLCGKYPAELYGEDYYALEFLHGSFLAVMISVAAIILFFYLLSWIFTKKGSKGWMVFALVFFSVDTGAMLLFNGISTDMIIDIAFHGWVVYSLATGVLAANKLKILPEEPIVVQAEELPEVAYGQNDQ